MLIVVDPHSGVPVYRQLMDQIKFHIASGLLAAGEQLPSTRALSGELGVNPMTVSKAYSYLEREDVVERRPGRPLVVKAHDDDHMRQRRNEQLRESLAPVIRRIKQMSFDNDEALRIFAEMLRDGDGTEAKRENTP